ncbi:MAG TPA: serine hydrolase domain-containing protein, partial [Thermoanaerobaculia bacterium]|nr:serine hydrolase domain-containing protein [Thermoanaerobaculia bacterium]
RIGAMWNTEKSEPHGWDSEERCTTIHPGGNGYGPMRELGRFYEMLLARGGQILSPQSVEALTARHRVGMMDSTFKHMMDWGLGFIPNSAMYGVETVPYAYGHHASRRAFGHSGYRSSVAFADPERGLAVALVFNGTPSDDNHERRIRTVLDALYEDLEIRATASG